MPKGNQVIGTAECFDCGAEVEVRVNKNRRTYYYCDGTIAAGGGSCGAHARWSQKSSAAMIAEAARAERGNHDEELQTEGGGEAGSET